VESVCRRILWVVVTALWPAMAGVRAEFHAHWAGSLALPCAVAEMGCALALRFWQARARELALEQEKRDAEERIAGLEARVSAYGKALAAMAAYGCPGDAPARRVAGGGGVAGPEPGTARLRLVPGQGKGG
jgi:hypothetical protein